MTSSSIHASSASTQLFVPANLSHLEFDVALKNDAEFLFLLETMITAFELQLKRFEEFYVYDDIENGDYFEALSERPLSLKLEEAKNLVETLAELSFYREDSLKFRKVCKGHKNEYIKYDIAKKEIDQVQKETEKEWRNRKEIKEFSFVRVDTPKLFPMGFNASFDLVANYYHVDDYKDCSSPPFKEHSIEDKPFKPILEEFQQKIESHHLNEHEEWSKLLFQIFKGRLNLIP